MDEVVRWIPEYPKNNREKISLRLSKDNEHWLINKTEPLVEEAKKNIQATGKSASNNKRNCKVRVSIPLASIPNCWKILRDKMKLTYKIPHVKIDAPRPPPAPTEAMSPLPSALALNATKLNTYRHPVPTNKVRTIIADKLVKELTRETRTNNVETKPATAVRIPYPREIEIHSARHKLPICTVPSKISTHSSRTISVENRLNNNDAIPPTISTATTVASTQTEKTFMIMEQDFNILQVVKTKKITESDLQLLEVVKDSGVKNEELQKQLDKIKKRKESSNYSDCTVIDIDKYFENISENNSNFEKLLRHSEQNKSFLLGIALAQARFAASSQYSLSGPGSSSPQTVSLHKILSMQTVQAISTPGAHPNPVTRDQIIKTPEARTLTELESLSANTLAHGENQNGVTATTPIEIENPFQSTVTCNELLRDSIAKTPTEINSTFAKTPATIGGSYRNNGHCNDLLSQTAITPNVFQTPSPANSFARAYPESIENTIASYKKTRVRPDAVETVNADLTLVLVRQSPTAASNTRTEDKNNNKNKEATSVNHTNIVMSTYEQKNIQQSLLNPVRPIVQELRQNETVVQQQQQRTSRIPVQILQSQMPRYARPDPHERFGQYVSRARKMQQQQAQYAQMRYQYPYQRDRPTTYNGPHIAPQLLQVPPPVQMYPNEATRQSLPRQMHMAPPRRVLSTEEANIHGQAVQRGRNWHYPIYYDRQGNYWPRRTELRH